MTSLISLASLVTAIFLAPAAARATEDFIVNDPGLALKRAQHEKKPILIDFFGIWCPPCNQMDARIFKSAKFAKAADGFIKLKLDVDKPESWPLKSRYKIEGYPTTIFANANGDELERILGLPTDAQFYDHLTKANRSTTAQFVALVKKADGGDRASADAVGVTYFERGDYAQAMRYLRETRTQKFILASAEVSASEKDPAEKRIPILERARTEFAEYPDSLDWSLELARLYRDAKEEEKAKVVLTATTAQAKALIANPKHLDESQYTVTDLKLSAASAYSDLGEEKIAAGLYREAAVQLLKESTDPWERGMSLRRAGALWKAGDAKESETLYSEMQKRYPAEFTFFYAHAEKLKGAKRFAEAAPLAQSAYRYSYGDNRLRSARLLAEVYIGEKKPAAAKAVLSEAIAGAVVPKDPFLYTQKYVDKLQDLRKTL